MIKIGEIILAKALYRPHEVAEMFSFSVSQIYDYVEEGKLSAHFCNGRMQKPMRITATSIKKFYEIYLSLP